MLNDETSSTRHGTEENPDGADNEQHVREIHALSPPPTRDPNWETQTQTHSHTHTHHPSSVSVAPTEGENFTSMSREFSALVLAGSTIDHSNATPSPVSVNMMHANNLGRIGEDDMLMMEETNPLAIVADSNPLEPVSASPPRPAGTSSSTSDVTSVQRVRKEEVEAKITAWQNAKVAKVNNRFKREDAVINGWENEQVQKATSWMKKVERKLEEKRARALEKMQNEVAKAHRKAEERRASAEAKRGTKVARVLEIANLMRAVGRAPTKRSFF
ncbi:Remorin 4.1, partial [Mucuna pruriens]